MTYEIGLLKLNPNDVQTPSLIPSQIQGMRIGQRYQFGLGNLAKFPPANLQGTRKSMICWNFKASLLLKPSTQENSAARSLLGFSAILDAKGNPFIVPLETTFSAYQISEVFIHALCEKAARQLKAAFGEDAELNFYFSAPGYDPQESEIYRNNIRSILKKIKTKATLPNTQFPQIVPKSGEQFLHEQFGVYYYFARCESKLDQPEANYLIIDIGGSTTDIAMVRLTQSGTLKRTAFPIYRSYQYGGSKFNETILELGLGQKIEPEHQSLALHEIEKAKLLLSNPQYRLNKFPIKVNGAKCILDQEILEAAFEQDWNWILKRYILEVISEAEQSKRFNSQGEPFSIHSILLAGGGSNLASFQAKLTQDPELQPYLGLDCKVIKAHKADPSSLAAIGLGISIAERVSKSQEDTEETSGELPTAEAIYFKIRNPEGKQLDIDRTGQKSLLFTISELTQQRSPNQTRSDRPIEFSKEQFSHAEIDTLPEFITLELTTDCNPTIQSQSIPLSSPKNIGRDQPQGLYFSIFASSLRSQDAGSTKLRLEPHFFQWLPVLRQHRRCDRGDQSPKIDLSLTAKPLQSSEKAIHVCVDFGMSNTSIAVYAPNRKLDPKYFQILPVARPDEIVEDTVEPSDELSDPAPLPSAEQETINSVVEQNTDINEAELVQSESERLESLRTAIVELTTALKVYSEQTTSLKPIAVPAKTPMPDSEIIAAKDADRYPDTYSEFKQFVQKAQYYYQEEVLRKIWTQSMNEDARLTVLAGPPGSGKSALVKLLARFFNRDRNQQEPNENYFYLLEPVLPSWFSSENLLGFYSQISQSFHATKFLHFIERSQRHAQQSNRKFFACLDEFNLAQPEQYLAKILSVIESSDRSMVVCQETGRTVTLTRNLKLFATINTDAASKSLSPKVLDRSILIRVIPSREQILNHAEQLKCSTDNEQQIFDELKKVLGSLFDLSQAAGQPFGYRTIDTSTSYLKSHPYTDTAASRLGEQQIIEVMDEILCSIFLSKLPGRNRFAEHKDYDDKLIAAETQFQKLKLRQSSNVIRSIRAGYPGQAAF